MNIEINKIPAIAKEYSLKVLAHAKFIFIVAIILLSAFLVYEINRLTTKEPTVEQITTQQEFIKRLRLDQEAIDKIERLQDQNVAVKSLFETARDNPFQD